MWMDALGTISTAAAAAKSLQSCPTLCDPIDGSPPGSPVPGILQARTLEWVCHFVLHCMQVKSESRVAQFPLTCSNPMDCSLPCSSIHGIFQASVLEWLAIAFSEGQSLGRSKNGDRCHYVSDVGENVRNACVFQYFKAST